MGLLWRKMVPIPRLSGTASQLCTAVLLHIGTLLVLRLHAWVDTGVVDFDPDSDSDVKKYGFMGSKIYRYWITY